jgi:uncharacterized protein YoaH (UPF0181 family)
MHMHAQFLVLTGYRDTKYTKIAELSGSGLSAPGEALVLVANELVGDERNDRVGRDTQEVRGGA